MDHPKCPKCGGEEFQLVEDVAHIFRHGEFVNGELHFECSYSEACYEASATAYRYVECSECCTRLENVPFRYVDGGEPCSGSEEKPFTNFDCTITVP